jgi:hypothetical protein
VVSIDNVIASMNEAKTHCARSWPSVKWLLGSGMATLTMVEDTMDAIESIITVSSTSHWQRSPWRVCNLFQGRGYQQGKKGCGLASTVQAGQRRSLLCQSDAPALYCRCCNVLARLWW